MASSKNSLVANINRRKKSGASRPKSRSTVSPEAYGAMQEGWPKKKTSSRKKTSTKAARAGKKFKKAGAAGKKTSRKRSAKKSRKGLRKTSKP